MKYCKLWPRKKKQWKPTKSPTAPEKQTQNCVFKQDSQSSHFLSIEVCAEQRWCVVCLVFSLIAKCACRDGGVKGRQKKTRCLAIKNIQYPCQKHRPGFLHQVEEGWNSVANLVKTEKNAPQACNNTANLRERLHKDIGLSKNARGWKHTFENALTKHKDASEYF